MLPFLAVFLLVQIKPISYCTVITKKVKHVQSPLFDFCWFPWHVKFIQQKEESQLILFPHELNLIVEIESYVFDVELKIYKVR